MSKINLAINGFGRIGRAALKIALENKNINIVAINDLTDNKTLIAVIFWIIAFFANRKKQRPVWIIIASIVMLMIYLIPHSMFGSEFNYDAGKVVTG